ncbi:aconitase X swivel domain-containing protein [Radicibacter daui]|uniref:aconitase X swivel domain-containing protein n=1 Tax=Radicibacter daui TaxID=3064829 RepID=UPI004046B4DE
MTSITLNGATLAPGTATGSPFLLSEPLSFWGGFDSTAGTIIDRRHPQLGSYLTGRIMLMSAGRGSCSGSSVLAEAIRRGSAPAGIILLARDAIVTVGALVAAELYQRHCPVVLAGAADWSQLGKADRVTIDARSETAELRLG